MAYPAKSLAELAVQVRFNLFPAGTTVIPRPVTCEGGVVSRGMFEVGVELDP